MAANLKFCFMFTAVYLLTKIPVYPRGYFQLSLYLFFLGDNTALTKLLQDMFCLQKR